MKTLKKSKWLATLKFALAIPFVIFSLASSWHSDKHNSGAGKTGNAPASTSNNWFMAGMSPNDYTYTTDSLVFQHGRRSALIKSAVDVPGGFSTLMQSCIINDFKGKRIKMTGYIKSEGANMNTSMWVRIDDFDNKVTADFDNMENRQLTGTNGWTKCEIVFDVPNSNYGLFFGVIVNGTGKVWFDNVAFEYVGLAYQKTAVHINTPLPQDYISNVKGTLTDLPERLPGNLDFEN